MKITVENLRKLVYRCDRGEWQDKKWTNVFYIYKDSCKNCGEPFLTQKRNKGLFCSQSCSMTKENNNMYDKKHSEESKKKMSESHTGKILTEEHKKKLSEAGKGENNHFYGKHHSEKSKKKISKGNKGNIAWNKNKKHSEESKKKMSESHKTIKNLYIKNNIPFYDTFQDKISFCESIRRNNEDPNILEIKCAYCKKWFVPTATRLWNRIQALNGELSIGAENRLYCSEQCKQDCPIFYKKKYQVGHPKANSNQYSREVQAELRQMCLERDGYICQKCGLHQDELESSLHCHHIEGIWQNPIESADLDMVITLCKECHKDVHKLPGCGYHEMGC